MRSVRDWSSLIDTRILDDEGFKESEAWENRGDVDAKAEIGKVSPEIGAELPKQSRNWIKNEEIIPFVASDIELPNIKLVA